VRLLFIATLGGSLLMMGHHSRSESLFYYFRIEDQVPENHLLRLIDRHVSLRLVREELRDAYSEAGRPSIDPEVLLRILLLGYLYGIRLCRLPQFDGISLRVMQTSKAPNLGKRFRVFDLNSCRS
jgi:hypothetical protein